MKKKQSSSNINKKLFRSDKKNIMFISVIFIGLTNLKCTSILPNKLNQPELPPRIIDAHTHTDRLDQNPKPDLNAIRKDYLASFNELGAQAAVAITIDQDYGYIDLRDKKVIHCVGIRSKYNIRALEKQIISKKYRCIKIYLGYVHKPATDPFYKPLFSLARKTKVPMVFHTGDTWEKNGLLKYADPIVIDEMAVFNRDIKFVIAHIGNPWIQTAAEVIYKNPNVYGDVSGLIASDPESLSPETVQELVVKPVQWAFLYIEDPSKLMFGSDFPVTHPKNYAKAIAKAIPRQHWDAVFFKNANNVYGLGLKD